MERLTWTEVHTRRLARHGLIPGAAGAGGVAEVARAICGAHAQVLSAAELSLGLRLPGTTRADVRSALWQDRTLVKAFGPRGTVHLLHADDLATWNAALAAVPFPNRFPDGVRLTPGQADDVLVAIGEALDGAVLTVDELSDAVVARTGPWAADPVMPAFGGMWPRWRQVLDVAGHRGLLCFAPNRGRNVTYTNPRSWLPDYRPVDAETATAQVLRWYLTAYGPALPEHFAQWLSAPKSWATAVFASADLEPVDVEGTPGWVVAGDTAPVDVPAGGVRLLPYFDAYQVGCHPRDRVFPGRARERALARTQAGNYPVVLVDGVVAGVWHLRRSGRRLALTVEPIGEPPAADLQARDLVARDLVARGLEAEVTRVGTILEGTPTLTIGPVAVGPHA